MKKTINSRIRNDLFPEMPQSFADKLTAALKTDGALNADQRSADEAPIAPVIPEQPKRRFPFGKVFSGIAAAVLALLCIVIAVFGIILPNARKTHGATHPDGYRADFPVGRWTLTAAEINGVRVNTKMLGQARGIWLEFTDDGDLTHGHDSGKMMLTGAMDGSDSIREKFLYRVNGNIITAVDEKGKTEEIVYDPKKDTLAMAHDYNDSIRVTLIFSYTPDAVIPEVQTTDGEIAATAKRNAAGIWKSGEGDTLWITDDGTARSEALSGLTGNLTYTVEDGTLHFSLTGTDFTFTARYDESKDTLSVTANGNTKLYSRVTGSIAGKWTLTGIEYNGSVGSPELFGMQMWLEINANGTAVMTMSMGDDMDVARFLYEISGAEIVLNEVKDTNPMTIRLTYDAETDTLHMDYSQYGYEGNSSLIFSRTPDAVIPTLTPDSAVDALQQEYKRLEKQYPEYFGLDISKGLKVYVWQMSEGSYSCALLAGSDNKTDVEIGGMRGVTIEEMLLILNTYEIEDNDIDVEVVPFRNPLSSYWYEIDEAYTEKLVWLLNGTPNPAPFLTESSESGETAYQVDDPDHILNVLTDVKVCDVDGDGQLESCRLSFGPTSGLFTVVFTVYRNGTVVYRNTFNMDYGTANFVLLDEGLSLEFVFAKNEPWTVPYLVTIENGVIVLTNMVSGNQVEYWGELDPQWNMAVVKTPEERLEGLWCAMSAEEGQDGLLEIGFYKDAATGKRMVFYWGGDFRYNGYSYTVEEQESRWSDEAYLFTLTDGDEICRITLYLYHQGDMRIDMDVDGKSYKKLTPITAEELPMKQDKYIFAGEGRVHYLDLVDLNGDGKPVRVSVYGYTPVSVVTGEEGESELTVQIGACEWKINEKLVMDSGIYIDLDPNDGHGNLLLSTTRADGTERTYELHVEGDAIVCGHIVEGYCFLNDSEQQELMLATPSDLLGAKYGCREVRGETLEPVDEWLQARALIERIMFVKREENIGDGTLLHLVRALPCEIDDKPATLEPGVYLHLREWHESMDRIVFLTEDDRWITVYLDGTKPYAVGGIPLTDYFDNAPKG